MNDKRVTGKTLRHGLDPNIKWMKLCGCWYLENCPVWQELLYRLLTFTAIGITFVPFLALEMYSIFYSSGDLDSLTATALITLTHSAQGVKFWYYFKNFEKIKGLVKQLEGNSFVTHSKHQEKIIVVAVKRMKVAFNLYLLLVMSAIGANCLMPLTLYSDTLPSYVVHPFHSSKSIGFVAMYIYLSFSMAIHGFTNVSMDTLASGNMVIIGAQVDLLNDTLANLKTFALNRIDSVLAQKMKNSRLVPQELQVEMNKLLAECINHHWDILRYTDEVGALFNLSVLSQFVTSAVIICITMFQLTLVSLFSLQFISMVLYQGCMLVEIFLYCWYGNEVILKSSDISLSAYSSDWTHCSIPYQKNLFILMIRSVVPIKLYAGNFFTLSVETFTAILRSSWSYFAVLNKVHDE